MTPRQPSPKHCPVCGIAMVASRSHEQSSTDDLFTCLNCDFVLKLMPPAADADTGAADD